MRISDWSSDVCSSDLASRSAPVESLRLDSGDGKQFISCSSTYDKGRGGRIAIIRPAGSGAGAKGEQFELDRRDIRDPALVLTSAILILAPPAVDRDAMIAPPPAVVIDRKSTRLNSSH